MACTVMVFDICSSTEIVEDLQEHDLIQHYKEFIILLDRFLLENKTQYLYTINKFLGDGYLLLFDTEATTDLALLFSIKLVAFCNDRLGKLIEQYLTRAKLRRLGITIGMDKGHIIELNLTSTNRLEYISKSMNIAFRLQSTLKDVDEVNTVLMSVTSHSEIKESIFRKSCKRKSRTLNHVENDKAITCYEFRPLFFETGKLQYLAEDRKQQVASLIAESGTIIQSIDSEDLKRINGIELVVYDGIVIKE